MLKKLHFQAHFQMYRYIYIYLHALPFVASGFLWFLISVEFLQGVRWYLWSSVFVVSLKTFSLHTSAFSTVAASCREHEGKNHKTDSKQRFRIPDRLQVDHLIFLPRRTKTRYIRTFYLRAFFRAFSQNGPHAIFESLHVHFLCRFSVVDLYLVDLQKPNVNI